MNVQIGVFPWKLTSGDSSTLCPHYYQISRAKIPSMQTSYCIWWRFFFSLFFLQQFRRDGPCSFPFWLFIQIAFASPAKSLLSKEGNCFLASLIATSLPLWLQRNGKRYFSKKIPQCVIWSHSKVEWTLTESRHKWTFKRQKRGW